ncbi:YraN family protein [Paenibacillus filicis]|uniref:UPF0102 protein O9H85_08330 n=1 Tax=Paenibacillus gyeongsangnamensis TaxID=3388067 RepID=A0ABT4Q6D7_9BACL|nr:YraN family protein [Paenibacillus filicis]MCZ8512439.1 YraN family protein [Paenibacillus filicis]
MSSQRLNRKQLGDLGEAAAEAHLRKAGFAILSRNWRCRTGEIDIIALDGEVLVFVEVRTRSGTTRFGTPLESVDARKMRQVIETAQVYMHTQRQQDRQVRFDVVSVETDANGVVLTIHHIRSAF